MSYNHYGVALLRVNPILPTVLWICQLFGVYTSKKQSTFFMFTQSFPFCILLGLPVLLGQGSQVVVTVKYPIRDGEPEVLVVV